MADKNIPLKDARKFFLIAGAVVLLDQIVKVVVKLNMQMGVAGQIRVLGDFFKIHFIENPGAAFGLTISKLVNTVGLDMSESTGKLILSIFSLLAVIAIGYVLYRISTHKSPLPYYVALIFGGALGNIIDRTFYGVFFSDMNYYDGGLFFGRVVDMFYLDIGDLPLPEFMGGGTYHLWPIFNIADAAISIGIVVLLIFQGRFFKMDEKAREAEKNTPEATASPETPKEESGADERPSEAPSAEKTETVSPLESTSPTEEVEDESNAPA